MKVLEARRRAEVPTQASDPYETPRLNHSNRLELFVYANDAERQIMLIARLDNLGKGASGAAVQNLNLALGLAETRGL